jgi:hypothetical protein
MVEQNEKMEEHNQILRDQQYVPEDFVKPKTEVKREFIALSPRNTGNDKYKKGGVNIDPTRTEPRE